MGPDDSDTQASSMKIGAAGPSRTRHQGPAVSQPSEHRAPSQAPAAEVDEDLGPADRYPFASSHQTQSMCALPFAGQAR
jgi:hypothetical protein